jgi:hypothetical protein
LLGELALLVRVQAPVLSLELLVLASLVQKLARVQALVA